MKTISFTRYGVPGVVRRLQQTFPIWQQTKTNGNGNGHFEDFEVDGVPLSKTVPNTLTKKRCRIQISSDEGMVVIEGCMPAKVALKLAKGNGCIGVHEVSYRIEPRNGSTPPVVTMMREHLTTQFDTARTKKYTLAITLP